MFRNEVDNVFFFFSGHAVAHKILIMKAFRERQKPPRTIPMLPVALCYNFVSNMRKNVNLFIAIFPLVTVLFSVTPASVSRENTVFFIATFPLITLLFSVTFRSVS